MPVTVQIVLTLLVLKVKAVRPLVAVAVNVIADAPKVTGVAGAKVTVCAAALMTTLALTEALVKLVLPAWLAVSVQMPVPTMVSWLPATVQMVLALLVVKVNAVKPLVAVALRVIADAPNVTGLAGANVTVCAAALMTTLAFAVALVKLVLPAWAAVSAQVPAPTMVS